MSSEHIAVARAVREAIDKNNLLYYNASFWRWRDRGVWARIDDREVQQEIHRLLDGGASGLKFGRSTVDSVLDLLRTECFRAEHQWNTGTDGINTASGVLDWTASANTWALRPHRREDLYITQIPIAYAPGEEAPRFLEFLEQIFEGDVDSRNKAQCLLEFIGASLLTTCRYERFLLLIGSGANGKTVVLKIVEALVGPDMVCAVQPSQLDNRFQRAHLAGKLVNIVTEIAEGAEIADAQLKAIVSGEITTAEHKHRPPFDFHPFAKCWFATNHMPHSRDFSDALFRRALVLQFNNRFGEGRADPHLIDKLRGELPGILNLALEAIGVVIQRGQFTEPESSLAAKREWRLQCDQAAQFFEDKLELVPGAQTLSRVLYSDYRSWAEEQGVTRVLSQKALLMRLVARYGLELVRSDAARWVSGVMQKVAGEAGQVIAFPSTRDSCGSRS